ncbi:hypothetical protein [Millisia brevis]|uniref:hypothetical protein n=1 Tax=Millisia brevis TaxID=264148 RepID=UPI0008325C85|nr:hypothetical protein [Millisia brevis]
MGIVEDVADELDTLIDRPGGITADNLVHCPTISALLAHGDAEQAYLVLDGIRRRNESRDVAAALAHVGGFGYAGNTEDRLNAFASAHHEQRPRGPEPPSTRTVRRWSDSGRRILADTIVRASGVEPPTLHLDVLNREGTTLIVLPTIYHMHSYVMNDPLLIMVGADSHAVQAFPSDDLELLREAMYQPKNALEVDLGFPVHLQLIWHGEVRPVIVTRTIGFAADITQMSSMTAGAVGLVLYREGQDIDTPAEVAAELGRFYSETAEDIM